MAHEFLEGCSTEPQQCCKPKAQSFIGAKVINAEQMDLASFKKEKNEPFDTENMEGYKVHYPDGYTSWSPKHVFEEAYRPISLEERNLIF